MKLIPKDALLAEIERRIKTNKECMLGLRNLDYYQGKVDALKDTLSFLDTLEMKGVDLEEYYHKFLEKEWFGNSHVRTISEMMAFTAKHFFELGLRSTITEEDCKLIWTIGDDIPYMAEEEFYKELLNRYKAQKGE